MDTKLCCIVGRPALLPGKVKLILTLLYFARFTFFPTWSSIIKKTLKLLNSFFISLIYILNFCFNTKEKKLSRCNFLRPCRNIMCNCQRFAIHRYKRHQDKKINVRISTVTRLFHFPVLMVPPPIHGLLQIPYCLVTS